MTSLEIPATGSAEVHVLHNGYVGLDGDGERVSGTVTLIVDGDAVIVVDPGMVADRHALLAALKPGMQVGLAYTRSGVAHTASATLGSSLG